MAQRVAVKHAQYIEEVESVSIVVEPQVGAGNFDGLLQKVMSMNDGKPKDQGAPSEIIVPPNSAEDDYDDMEYEEELDDPDSGYYLPVVESGQRLKVDPEKGNNPEELHNFFLEREKVYQNRRRHIQQVCEHLGKEGHYGSEADIPLRRLRWLNQKKLIMCFNAKVGTSTWTQYLMESGFPGVLKNATHWHYTAERFLKPPNKRRSSDSLELMKHYTKVILVRDPFARIVSAFLDKIVSMRFGALCREIVRIYRPINSTIDHREPTFEEFVRFLIDQTPNSNNITVIRNHRTDRHWFHYYANCAPCDINYDIIATMETVHEDTRYIIKKYDLGIADTIWNNHVAKSSSEETALEFFQLLPRNLTLELYQRYRVDFSMFGYDVGKYLKKRTIS